VAVIQVLRDAVAAPGSAAHRQRERQGVVERTTGGLEELPQAADGELFDQRQQQVDSTTAALNAAISRVAQAEQQEQQAHEPVSDRVVLVVIFIALAAAAVFRIVQALDYSNFKTEVAVRHSYGRAHVYGDVWSACREIEAETRSD
jgi:hypothetical protein